MIKKIKEGYKSIFSCPLCGADYSDYDQASDCLRQCATHSHNVEERVIDSDIWQCSECREKFNSQEKVDEHPVNCLLAIASTHPTQKKLIEVNYD